MSHGCVMPFVVRWRATFLVVLVGALASGGAFVAPPAHASPGQPFGQLQSPFTQALFGTSGQFLGGVAFAPNGDVWADECGFSGSPLHRFSAMSQTFIHGTTVHDATVVASNAGCGLTNGPGGLLYSNTEAGLARLDASTGAPIDVVGPPGNALGVTVDPRTQQVVYVGGDCRFTSTCTLRTFDPSSGAAGIFAQLPSDQATFVDGITFDPTGDHLLLSVRAPGFRLVVLDRSGHVVSAVPMSSEPDGISFHSTDPQFVVTNDTDGTMTRFDFPNGDLSKPATQTVFASAGFRGDLSLVGPDGCIYLSQAGSHYLDGTTTGENSVVQICPGFSPSPGVAHDHLVYVALGDSYSSGEGAPPFEDGTNYPPAGVQENTLTYGPGANGCHRSLTNYAKVAAPLLSPSLEPVLFDRTCSGAEIVPDKSSAKGPIVPTSLTANRSDGQVDQALSRLTATGRSASDVQLVSATMGGNDAGFGDLIQACLIPNLAQTLFKVYDNVPGEIQWILDHFGDCKRFDGLLFHTDDKIKKLKDLEVAAQGSLLLNFPGARALQLTYPGTMPDGRDFAGDSCGGVLRSDASYVRSKVDSIDSAIRDAASTTSSSSCRFGLVDVQGAFGANALCPADPSKALANGIDQARLESVVSDLVAPGSETRRLIDNLSDRYRGFRDCVTSHSFFLPAELLCKGPYDNLKQALSDLQAYFTGDKIQALVGSLAAGGTPEQRFDNSRLFFHPNAVGFGVMACNLTAVYQHTSQQACAPSLGGVLTYIMNGVRLSHVDPLVLVPGAPVPFQFNGFDAATNVNAVVHSASVPLGTFGVDGNGGVAGDVTLPANLNPGVHKVTFSGTNHGVPRRIDVLVRIDGRPRGGDDYGFYVPGFTGDSQVSITYSGLDYGTITPNEEGGVFVEVPLPRPSAPGSVTITLTGLDTHRVVTQNVSPAPLVAGAWARGTGADALTIVGSGINISTWLHSDGGVAVHADGTALTGGVEYATTYTQQGNGLKVSPAPVLAGTDGSPLAVDVAAWRPAGASAQALGAGYRAVPASACDHGYWQPASGQLTATVTYVPCGVRLSVAGPVKSAVVAEGPIVVPADGVHLQSTAVGFVLATGSTAAGAVSVTGSGFLTASSIWAAGGVSLSGQGSHLACGIYAQTISIRAAGAKLGPCA